MPEEKIRVIAYSGYRGEETPRTILLHGERIEVFEILRQWIEEKSGDRAKKRFYQVKGSDGNLYMIYFDEKAMEWFRAIKD